MSCDVSVESLERHIASVALIASPLQGAKHVMHSQGLEITDVIAKWSSSRSGTGLPLNILFLYL